MAANTALRSLGKAVKSKNDQIARLEEEIRSDAERKIKLEEKVQVM